MPPNKILTPDGPNKELADIRRRLLALETAGIGSAVGSAGNPLFDALGLIGVMKPLGSIRNIIGDNQVGTGNFQTAAGSTVTFSLTRAATVLGLGAANVNALAVSQPNLTILVDGVQNDANGPIVYCNNNTSLPLGVTPFVVVSLAAGSHTFSIALAIAAGQTWVASTYYLYAFLLGA